MNHTQNLNPLSLLICGLLILTCCSVVVDDHEISYDRLSNCMGVFSNNVLRVFAVGGNDSISYPGNLRFTTLHSTSDTSYYITALSIDRSCEPKDSRICYTEWEGISITISNIVFRESIDHIYYKDSTGLHKVLMGNRLLWTDLCLRYFGGSGSSTLARDDSLLNEATNGFDGTPRQSRTLRAAHNAPQPQ